MYLCYFAVLEDNKKKQYVLGGLLYVGKRLFLMRKIAYGIK